MKVRVTKKLSDAPIAIPITTEFIKLQDFLKFANACEMDRSTAEKLIESLIKFTPKWLSMCEKSLLTDGLKERLSRIITERAKILE